MTPSIALSTKDIELPQPSRAELATAIREVVAHVTAQMETAPSLAPRVRGEDWSVADAAAHLAIAQQVFAEVASGGDHPFQGTAPTNYGEVNARLIEESGDRDRPQLVRDIRAHTDAFLATTAAAEPGGDYDTPVGSMPLDALLSYNLSHLLQHAHSISAALELKSPIHDAHPRLAVPFLRVATPFAYRMSTRPRIEARLDMRVRGQFRFVISLSKTEARVEAPGERGADCHVVTGPVPFMLIMLGQTDPLRVLLRGQTFAWGRRPWLALQLKDYLPGL
ncbi:MAG: hypothetical protein QOK05_2373 [Chloroflexota bacterium]|jgi:uncharacterized protein (TIGR03083 family)|nr:hypothetical protein [Chloroflexota bacterium]